MTKHKNELINTIPTLINDETIISNSIIFPDGKYTISCLAFVNGKWERTTKTIEGSVVPGVFESYVTFADFICEDVFSHVTLTLGVASEYKDKIDKGIKGMKKSFFLHEKQRKNRS